MSSRSTFTPSRAQMYCCFRRDPHPLWIQLNETELEPSEAEYIWTGTETSPNEIDAVASGLAAISRPKMGFVRGLKQDGSAPASQSAAKKGMVPGGSEWEWEWERAWER